MQQQKFLLFMYVFRYLVMQLLLKILDFTLRFLYAKSRIVLHPT